MRQDWQDWLCGLANACQGAAMSEAVAVGEALERVRALVVASGDDLHGIALVVARGVLASFLVHLAEHLEKDQQTLRACWLSVQSSDGIVLRTRFLRAQQLLLNATFVHREDRGDAGDQRVSAALSYIAGHYVQPSLRLDEVARVVKLSTCHFDRLFTKTLGIGFRAYVKAKRLDHARTALCDHEKSVKEIAYVCGYKTQAAFCRDFRTRFGLSPGAYRHTVEVPPSKCRSHPRQCPLHE